LCRALIPLARKRENVFAADFCALKMAKIRVKLFAVRNSPFISMNWGNLILLSALQRPFRVNFHTDVGEATSGKKCMHAYQFHPTLAIDMTADMNEQDEAPGGIVGFDLIYFQRAC